MRKRIVYWLCEKPSTEQREKYQALQSSGYSVSLVTNYTSLTEGLQNRRANIIIVGDEAPETKVEDIIIEMSIRPELQGVRFILSLTRPRPELARLAANCSFRDIIPIELPTDRWLTRFLYATAGSSMGIEVPQPQVAMNEIAAVNCPARVVWISQTEINIESRAHPEIGSILSLSGALATTLGVNSISLKTTRHYKSNLAYRFSEGFTAKWTVPERHRDHALAQLASIRKDHFKRRHKVFVALRSPENREKITGELSSKEFLVSTALKKNSLVHEPFYFGPDLIIIEEKLLIEDYFKRYVEMTNKISSRIPILIIGQETTAQKLEDIDPNRKIFTIEMVEPGISDKIKSIVADNELASRNHHEDTIFVNPKSRLSISEIRLSARLSQLHPNTVTMDMPSRVGLFALVKVGSPLIHKLVNRDLFVKITNSYERVDRNDSPFRYRIEGLLSDTFKKDEHGLSRGLVSFLETGLTDQFTLSKTVSDAQAPSRPNEAMPDTRTVSDKATVRPEVTRNQEERVESQRAGYENESNFAVANLDDQASTQLINRDILEPLSNRDEDSREPSPIHLEASFDDQIASTKVHDLPRKLGKLVGPKKNLNILILLGFFTFVVAAFYFAKVYNERNWGKDQGKVFVDSLRGYAPKAFERGLPQKRNKNSSPPTSR